MAECCSSASFSKAISYVLVQQLVSHISLKNEQRSAIKAVCKGSDVFVCLPMGYEKSLCCKPRESYDKFLKVDEVYVIRHARMCNDSLVDNDIHYRNSCAFAKQWSKHLSNTAAIVTLGLPSVRCAVLVRKLSLLLKLMNDGTNGVWVRVVHCLEEHFGTSVTA